MFEDFSFRHRYLHLLQPCLVSALVTRCLWSQSYFEVEINSGNLLGTLPHWWVSPENNNSLTGQNKIFGDDVNFPLQSSWLNPSCLALPHDLISAQCPEGWITWFTSWNGVTAEDHTGREASLTIYSHACLAFLLISLGVNQYFVNIMLYANLGRFCLPPVHSIVSCI